MPNAGAKSSAKTYRKATNLLADELDIEPGHGERPSEDFERMVDHVGDELRERAKKYYRLGIRRGLIAACDRMLQGNLALDGDTLELSDGGITVKVRVKFAPSDNMRHRSFKFSPSELGFET